MMLETSFLKLYALKNQLCNGLWRGGTLSSRFLPCILQRCFHVVAHKSPHPIARLTPYETGNSSPCTSTPTIKLAQNIF